jgi:preprotein translocase subunit YajC
VNVSFIIILLLLALAWIVLVRPQRRRQAAQEALYASLRPGDEIVTAGGLFGRIEAVRDDELEVEIAPGTVVRVARRAVAGKIEPEEDEEPEEEPTEVPIPDNES